MQADKFRALVTTTPYAEGKCYYFHQSLSQQVTSHNGWPGFKYLLLNPGY